MRQFGHLKTPERDVLPSHLALQSMNHQTWKSTSGLFNDVSNTYSMSKLCSEDCVGTLFMSFIKKGQVLPKYQACGASHYYLLLWVNGAPLTIQIWCLPGTKNNLARKIIQSSTTWSQDFNSTNAVTTAEESAGVGRLLTSASHAFSILYVKSHNMNANLRK